MSLEFDYSTDSEFSRLLARQPGVDLTVAALELARDAEPGLQFSSVLDWLDARARELAAPVARLRSDRDVLNLIGQSLSGTHGITGHPDAYGEADGSFLNRVIEKQRGIPISLSVLYMGLCQRLGIDLRGVAAPMHFLTRLDGAEEPLFVDPFSAGRVLTEAQAVAWLQDLTQKSPSEIRRALRPVAPRLIITRMLTNLKFLYARNEDWPRLLQVQSRLLALNPAEYSERRDLALVSLRAERPGTAVRLLKSLLNTCPETERELLNTHLAEARRQVSRWN